MKILKFIEAILKCFDRLYNSSNELNAEVVVYIGGDPLLDPIIVSDAIDFFISSKIDYLNNYDPPTFPGGQDINIVSFDALKKHIITL